MDLPEKRITDFIRKHHVITLATSARNIPWTAHCFYTYIAEKNWLVFTSNLSTRHAAEAMENSEVAGGIVLETSVIGKIQGIQLSGRIRRPAPDEENVAKKAYLVCFPFAVLMETTLWIVDITYIKMTDNRLGFGNKLIWEKRV